MLVTEVSNPNPDTQSFQLTGNYGHIAFRLDDEDNPVVVGTPSTVFTGFVFLVSTTGTMEIRSSNHENQVVWAHIPSDTVSIDLAEGQPNVLTVDEHGISISSLEGYIFTFAEPMAATSYAEFRLHLHGTTATTVDETVFDVWERTPEQAESDVDTRRHRMVVVPGSDGYPAISKEPSMQDYVLDDTLRQKEDGSTYTGPTLMLYGQARDDASDRVVINLHDDGESVVMRGTVNPFLRSYTPDKGGVFTVPVDHWHLIEYDLTKTTIHLSDASTHRTEEDMEFKFTHKMVVQTIDMVLLDHMNNFVHFASVTPPRYYTNAQLMMVQDDGISTVVAIAINLDGSKPIHQNEDLTQLLKDERIQEGGTHASDANISAHKLLVVSIMSSHSWDALHQTTIMLAKAIPTDFEAISTDVGDDAA
jgi:hypothetical protein